MGVLGLHRASARIDGLRTRLYGVLTDVALACITWVPGATGRGLRRAWYSRRLRSCGRNLCIDEGVIIDHPEYVSIGDDVWIDRYCILTAGPTSGERRILTRHHVKSAEPPPREGDLEIGDGVHLAPFCVVQAHGGVRIAPRCGFSTGVRLYSCINLATNPHHPGERIHFGPGSHSAYTIGPIVLEENVGVSVDVLILPGVSIGRASFVDARSIVVGSYGENSRIAGSPASVVRPRFGGPAGPEPAGAR